jgi:hypothetical protein
MGSARRRPELKPAELKPEELKAEELKAEALKAEARCRLSQPGRRRA